MNYVYFLYSEEQFNEKNKILSKSGKTFEPGTVIVGGTRKKYTQKHTGPSLPRFIDTKIVAEGDINLFTYTEPKIMSKRGN